ncbi:MAG: FAD-binding oxidoreductase [Anaerolineae bacterium]|nr:FAD-binding oxidoreductase [Anaerolineae bacterium]
MTVSIWQTSTEQPLYETDVVIIGAGLVGCAAAYYLRQAGRYCLLLEARDVGLGASSRNAGFMLSGLDLHYHQAEARYGEAAAREIWELSWLTHAFWRQVGTAQGVEIRQEGSWLLAEDAQEAAELEQAARRMEACGFTCEFKAGDVLSRGFAAALHQPGDGALHPYALVQALYRSSGAALMANSEVYALESQGSSVMVLSRLARVRARYVLICVNGYAAGLDPYFASKIIPTRAQCLATGPLAQRALEGIGYADYGYYYFRDLPDGGFLLGGGRKHHKAQEGNTTDDRTSAEVQSALENYLKQHFADVAAQASIVRRWAGIMGFTADGLPLVGALPERPNIGFAIGLNGHGLSLGQRWRSALLNTCSMEWRLAFSMPGAWIKIGRGAVALPPTWP